jgi:hypothetical protein
MDERRPRRGELNDKRRFADITGPIEPLPAAESISYGGNPEHKRRAGDFALTPPAAPNPDKTLCDQAQIFERAVALRLLREGLKRRMISPQREGLFPKRIWAVSDNGWALEARLDNSEQGNYHGYPLDINDRFRAAVLKRWNA